MSPNQEQQFTKYPKGISAWRRHLSGNAWTVLTVIHEKIAGWDKESDAISLSQIEASPFTAFASATCPLETRVTCPPVRMRPARWRPPQQMLLLLKKRESVKTLSPGDWPFARERSAGVTVKLP